MKTQWWLAELDMHGNPELTDGAHSVRAGAEKALTLMQRLGLAKLAAFSYTPEAGMQPPVQPFYIGTGSTTAGW